jgi:predicted membrane protein (TIGR00267 family)
MTSGALSCNPSRCSSPTCLSAFIPVIPFAFFSLDTARIISVSITAILLVLLGVARGIVAKSSTLRGALETLGITTAAAITGYFIGKLVTR